MQSSHCQSVYNEAGMTSRHADEKTGLDTMMETQVTVGHCTQHCHNFPLNLSLFQRIPHTEPQTITAPLSISLYMI